MLHKIQLCRVESVRLHEPRKVPVNEVDGLIDGRRTGHRSARGRRPVNEAVLMQSQCDKGPEIRQGGNRQERNRVNQCDHGGPTGRVGGRRRSV